MAENTQERKTFKYGEQDYLSDDFLRAHATYKQSFLNFAKEKGLFDEESLKELSKAIDARANAIRESKSFSADGILEGDTVHNVTYKVDKPRKHGLSRKDKYLSQDITEWAKHYINKLVGQLKTNSGKSAKSWDISKYGLGAYLTGQGLDAQDIFENYDVRDPNQSNNPRSYSQRRQLLLKHLPGYKTWLQQQGFDYTQNDNEWDDNFNTDLDSFITEYTNNENYNINDLAAALRRFGAGDKYTKAFTSNKWELSGSLGADGTSGTSGTDGSGSEEEARRKAKIQGQNTYITSQYDLFRNLTDNDLGGKTYFSTPDGKFEMSDDEWIKWTHTHTDDGDTYMKQLQSSYYQNPFDTNIAAEYLPVADRLGALQEVTIDGKTYKYDPRTIDRQKLRFVAFNPVTGEIRHAFIGDIEEEKQALLRKWRIDNGYEKESDKYLVSEKQGGVISMQMGGEFDLATAVRQELERENNARAEQTGNTPEIQKARDRVVSNGDQSFISEKNSIRTANAGFTGAEIARLASIGADIASLFFDPLTGTAIGVGSTLTNFGADIADDGFQWEDVKNLGINLGFDLLGAIPVYGDIAGTGSKIIKNLAKWTPRIMASLAAYQGVQNFDGIMESYNKFLSGDADKKLTVQDWRNIAQGIGLITGGIRAGKNKHQQLETKKQAKLDDVIGITIIDKSKPNAPVKKQILVDGDIAKAIKSSDGSKAAVEAELNKLEAFKDKFGANGTYEVNTKNNGERQFPIGRITEAGSKKWEWKGFKKEGKVDVSDVYDFNKATGRQVFSPIGKAIEKATGRQFNGPIKKARQKLNDKHLELVRKYNNGDYDDYRGAKTAAEVDVEIANLKQALIDQAGKVKPSMDKRSARVGEIEQALVPERARLEELNKKLNGVADEVTLKTNERIESSANETSKTSLQKLNDAIENLEKQLKSVKQAPLPRKDPKGYNRKQEIKDLQRKLDNLKNQRVTEQGAQQLHQKALDDIQQQLSDRADLVRTESEIKRLEKILPQLQRTNHTNAYKKLEAMIQDYRQRYSNVSGRKVTWDDTNKFLADAGVKDAFKHGGSINKNKLNKFLNYAKG